MTTKRIWHSGPPPHIGWWNASNDRTLGAWRWWDGEAWSTACWEDLGPDEVPRAPVRDTNDLTPSIRWTDYWPKNARVSRLSTKHGHWTFGVPPKDLPDTPHEFVPRDAPRGKGWSTVCRPSMLWNPADIEAWRLL